MAALRAVPSTAGCRASGGDRLRPLLRELRALGRDRNLLVVVLARLERYASRHGNGGPRAELAVLLAHGEGH